MMCQSVYTPERGCKGVGYKGDTDYNISEA